jgi:peptide/nickel transport system substrate-binding protein
MSNLAAFHFSPRVLAPGLVVLAALGLAPAAGAMAPADTLVIGKTQDPQSLDPAVTMDNNDWTVTYPCYQRLMKYKVVKGAGSTSVDGELAESWKVSKDSLVWDFKLRKGQKFDDGSPVDAAAVKASFDRMMKIAQGPSEAFPTDMKVSVVDPMTVRFTLTKVFAPFLYTLANNGAAVVNAKAMAKPDAGEEGKAFFSRNSAGSGAFRLTSWQKGQSLVLEPNPYYGGAKPALKKVVVRIIGESSSRRLQLENGDLDIAESLPEDQLMALKGKANIRVAEFPSLRVTYLYLNNKRAPLDNPAVRQAISYAVDYDGIIKGVMKGQAKQMRGPIPEGMWGYDPSVLQYKLDLAKAKALLAKANPAHKNITFLYSPKDPNWEPIGLSLQANLSALGFSVKMENMANAPMREKLGKADFDISIGYWTPDFADPYMFMNYWFETGKHGLPGNRAFYSNPEVDKMVLQAASLTDQKQRTALYQKAQKIVVNDAPYVYLYQANYQAALRSSVKGFIYQPMLEQIFNVDGITKR